MNYYNEIDPYAAQWLRNLIDAGHIAPGVVDTRSIEDVRPDELAGFVQCHFFAGIGGWAHALDLAGWPRDRPVWTGSCPCQPFSTAGKGNGFADERHLWPAWQHLIAQCNPPDILGEQVASKAVDAWIDLVHADMEGMGYAFGSIPFPAASIGAPHIRDRNYWMAHTDGGERHWISVMRGNELNRKNAGWSESCRGPSSCSETGGVANREFFGFRGERLGTTEGTTSGVQGANWQRERLWPDPGTSDSAVAVRTVGADPNNDIWRGADWLRCTDEKWRPVEPGTFPLAHGVSGRVGRLRAYGNAIVPQQAAHFIEAMCEARGIRFDVMEKVA